MDTAAAAAIVASGMTVADKIRALNAEGFARADIARLLGKRYQHVRNVLEEDKLHGAARQARPTGPAYPRLQEPGVPFAQTYRLVVDEEGRVVLPREVMAVLGGRSGVLIADLEEDRLVILSGRAAAARARSRIADQGSDPRRMLSEELIAERRAEAAREDADG